MLFNAGAHWPMATSVPNPTPKPVRTPKAKGSIGNTVLQQRLYSMRLVVSGTADVPAGASEP